MLYGTLANGLGPTSRGGCIGGADERVSRRGGAILALADAMKIQLIMVTGIKEYETLSVFKRFVRANKVRQNLTKQREVVGIVDYQFKSPTSAA